MRLKKSWRKPVERHDMVGKPEYQAYSSMIKRCYVTTCKDFKDYGGRGITVCERWKQSFIAFLADMGMRTSRNHTLDRIDNEGNYEPGNCRWATQGEQAVNRRSNVRLVLGQESLTLTEWSRRLGIGERTIRRRRSEGASDEKALAPAYAYKNVRSLEGSQS